MAKMNESRSNSVTQVVTRTYWRAIAVTSLVLAVLVVGTGSWFVTRENARRINDAAAQVQALLIAERNAAHELMEQLSREPTVRNGVAVFTRYPEAIAELPFFLPVAQEMSSALLTFAHLLPPGGALRIELPGAELFLAEEQVWWRHQASGSVFAAKVGGALHPETDWPAAEPGPDFRMGWQWQATAQRLVFATWQGDAQHEPRIRVVWPLPRALLESVLVRSGWALESVRETAKEMVRLPNDTAPPLLVVGEAHALRLLQASGPTLIFELTNLMWRWGPFWFALAVGIPAVVLVAIAAGVVLRRGLARSVTRPLRALQRGVERLATEGNAGAEALRNLPAHAWPTEIAAVRDALVHHWERAQRRSEENRRLALALTHVADGVVVTDTDERILYLNPAAETFLGFTLAEAAGKRPGELWASQRTPKKLYNVMRETLARGEKFFATFHNRTRWGQEIDLEETIAPVKDEAGRLIGYVATFHEVTEAQKMIAALKTARFTDPLTGLPNRLAILERVRGWLMTQQTVTLVHLDIDHFAAVNARCGLTAGDRLLREFGARLQALQKPHEGSAQLLVAHLEGDSFALAWLGDPDRYLDLLTALQTEVAALEIATSDGEVCSVTLSLGVAVAPKDGKTPEALLQAAEYAVRSVKGRGGGQIAFYDPQWGERVRARTALVLRMERALAANEFALFLQPVVRSDGALVAAEALIRWLPPEQTPISPAEFIPLAEESGFIRRLGGWVFEEALRLAERLRQTGWGTPQIAVNVSPLQLEDDGFVQQVHRALEHWRAVAEGAPFPLTLELTESAAMERFEQLKLKIEYLARAEVPFAIDDFGTGHSSLGRLRELPFAKLKIDRSFVVRLFDSPRDEALVASIIRIAHAFDVKVVAEGVEEARFVTRLSELGCDEFQGYYFAKPMPADVFIAWMGDHLR